MAILDDVIGVFSPGWKAARLRSRAVIQAYEAVKTTRTHKARRENRTADQLSQYGAVSLREQARYLDNNHDLVIGVFDKLEERVVGKNGIIVEPHPVLRNGAIARDLAAEIRTRWSEWSVSPEVTGQFTRPMYRAWLKQAVASGVIRLPRDLDLSSLYTAVYSGPVMPWIDPVKEAEAWKIQIRGGAATESDWVRAGGRNPDDVKRRRKAEIDENRKLDLVFDTDPASDKGGSSAATKRQEPQHTDDQSEE